MLNADSSHAYKTAISRFAYSCIVLSTYTNDVYKIEQQVVKVLRELRFIIFVNQRPLWIASLIPAYRLNYRF